MATAVNILLPDIVIMVLMILERMQQLELIKVNFTETTKDHTSQNVQAGTLLTPHDREMEWCSPRPKLLERKAYQETNEVWYSGVFGRVTFKKRTKHSTDPAYLKVFGSKSLAEETSVTIVPSITRCLLEVRLAHSLGKVSRSLNVYPVVTYDSPIIKMCSNGDMHGLQAVFSSGQMSPFAHDEIGNTLLHVRIFLVGPLKNLNVISTRLANPTRNYAHG